jgi:hypothetical protein
MGISYCGLNCLECDFYKLKICTGCKIKKKDWGCHIRKCAQIKNVPDCCKCETSDCKKYRKLIYKVSRPLMPFDLEKNRKRNIT